MVDPAPTTGLVWEERCLLAIAAAHVAALLKPPAPAPSEWGLAAP